MEEPHHASNHDPTMYEVPDTRMLRTHGSVSWRSSLIPVGTFNIRGTIQSNAPALYPVIQAAARGRPNTAVPHAAIEDRPGWKTIGMPGMGEHRMLESPSRELLTGYSYTHCLRGPGAQRGCIERGTASLAPRRPLNYPHRLTNLNEMI
jgi:hypothetical protein